MKRILHLVSVKNITFKSLYNWCKIDILRQLQPLTANYLATFIVTSTTIYTQYKAQTMCKTYFGSQGVTLDGFKQKNFLEKTPSPLHDRHWMVRLFPIFWTFVWLNKSCEVQGRPRQCHRPTICILISDLTNCETSRFVHLSFACVLATLIARVSHFRMYL